MASKLERRNFAIIAATALVSAIAFYFGTGLHPIWWLTWLAPLPVLLIASRVSSWCTFACSGLALLAGELNLWHYLHRALGIPLLPTLIILVLPAVIFALGVLLFRWCILRAAPLTAGLILPAYWVSYEFLNASTSIHSTAGNQAYSQMNFLPILQIASITGIWGIGFCVFLFPATIAAVLAIDGKRRQKVRLGLIAGVFLCFVLGFGTWRLHRVDAVPTVSVALIASDLPENVLPTTKEDSLRLLRDYVAQVNALSGQSVQAVVIPEKVAVVLPDYLGETDKLFSDAAARAGATVVVGLVRRDSDSLWNEARIYSPDGSAPRRYEKHHMLPPFESKFTIGTIRTLLTESTGLWGVAICKDMDFPELSRKYGLDGIGLLLVPAWDFDLDGWWHGRMAILRGIEDGFSIARAPRHGILTVTDDRGRVLAERATNSLPFTVLLAQVPVRHEATLYSHWGNWFAWLCVLLLFALPFSLFPAPLVKECLGSPAGNTIL